jgi:3-phosphoshikimate 1-carboxyvinyltransferase
MSALTATPGGPLAGSLTVPGDKSISHRALILGALSVGETRISGLLEGDDVKRTAAAMRALGARVEREGPGRWRVMGVGVGGLAEPAEVLDMGNSGTGARLVAGALAGHPFTAFLTGDESLCRRPMKRITDPLTRMGAAFLTHSGHRLPMAVTGATDPLPIVYRLPVPSAQVKSAILLAGLAAPGQTTVIEPEPTRDHTERMLRHFGARVDVEDRADGRHVTLHGQPELAGAPVAVPADPSSAAFPAVAALIVPGSSVRLAGIGMNPLRAGLFETLSEMGARITIENRREEGGEPVADLVCEAGPLKGVRVPASRAPAMIDEYPILAVCAAFASGETRMEGLAELRVKESDRLAAVADGLAACGVDVEATADSLVVRGNGKAPRGGATIPARLDHRIAMSFLVLGLAAEQPVSVDDGGPIDTSFPDFVALMNTIGAGIAATRAGG